MAALGLCCCAQAFSSCGTWGPVFAAVSRLLFAVASRCGAQSLECVGFSYGVWAELLWGVLNLPGPGVKTVSLAMTGWFLTTGPPKKSLSFYIFKWLKKKWFVEIIWNANISIHVVFLEQSRAYLFMNALWLHLCYREKLEGLWLRPWSLKYLPSDSLQKMFADVCHRQ